MIHFKLF